MSLTVQSYEFMSDSTKTDVKTKKINSLKTEFSIFYKALYVLCFLTVFDDISEEIMNHLDSGRLDFVYKMDFIWESVLLPSVFIGRYFVCRMPLDLRFGVHPPNRKKFRTHRGVLRLLHIKEKAMALMIAMRYIVQFFEIFANADNDSLESIDVRNYVGADYDIAADLVPTSMFKISQYWQVNKKNLSGASALGDLSLVTNRSGLVVSRHPELGLFFKLLCFSFGKIRFDGSEDMEIPEHDLFLTRELYSVSELFDVTYWNYDKAKQNPVNHDLPCIQIPAGLSLSANFNSIAKKELKPLLFSQNKLAVYVTGMNAALAFLIALPMVSWKESRS